MEQHNIYVGIKNMRIRLIKIIVIMATLTIGSLAFAEDEESIKRMGPFVNDFNENLKTATWLHWYDNVAWLSSDAVLEQDKNRIEQLGHEWFVYDSDDTPNAVFGRYDPEKDTYDPVFHFIIDKGTNKALLTNDPVDSSFALCRARALYNAKQELDKTIKEIPVSMNQYIRMLASEELEVWFLPGSIDNVLIYGVELCFTFDKNGEKLLKKHVLNRGFRGINPDKTKKINIGNGTYPVPSVGEIFFSLTFERNFEKIYIASKYYLSSKIDYDGQSAWVHSEIHEAEDTNSSKVTKDSNKELKATDKSSP